MILLLPTSYLLLEKNKLSFLGTFPLFYIALTIGTKVATFGPLIIAFIAFIYYILKKDTKKILYSLLILIIVGLLIPHSYAIQNYKFAYLLYLKSML